jgi:hypothetical protein
MSAPTRIGTSRKRSRTFTPCLSPTSPRPARSKEGRQRRLFNLFRDSEAIHHVLSQKGFASRKKSRTFTTCLSPTSPRPARLKEVRQRRLFNLFRDPERVRQVLSTKVSHLVGDPERLRHVRLWQAWEVQQWRDLGLTNGLKLVETTKLRKMRSQPRGFFPLCNHRNLKALHGICGGKTGLLLLS